jgi:hypothetical protein
MTSHFNERTYGLPTSTEDKCVAHIRTPHDRQEAVSTKAGKRKRDLGRKKNGVSEARSSGEPQSVFRAPWYSLFPHSA